MTYGKWMTGLALLAAAAAHAEGPLDYPAELPWQSMQTRAQVRATLVPPTAEEAAKAQAEAKAAEAARPKLTRAQVVAEMHAARERGELDAIHGEDGGSSYFARLQATPDSVRMAGAPASR